MEMPSIRLGSIKNREENKTTPVCKKHYLTQSLRSLPSIVLLLTIDVPINNRSGESVKKRKKPHTYV